MKWYENSYRRHLLDMHIDDWNPLFLSKFDPSIYLQNLKRANVKSAMVYLQSHVGLCYWPTKHSRMHKAFVGRENTMKKFIELCHNNEIGVIGYYSLIFNNWAHDNHTDWRMVGIDGISDREKGLRRYGRCCPNNPHYEKFVLDEITDLLQYFEVDGMFYDMPYFPQYCYCESCKKRWATECDGEIPTEKSDMRWEEFENKRRQWIGEFSQKVYNKTKELKPHISVSQNYAQAANKHAHLACSEPVNAASDYACGDLYNGFLTQTFACKFYYSITKHQPFEYMTGRCEPNLQSHTVTKTKDKLETAFMLTCAHHGANFLIDAIDPVGTMDERVYARIGELYKKVKEYEPYFSGKMLQNVGVYFSLPSKANLQNQNYSHYSGTLNSIQTMVQNHIPVGIVTTENIDKINEYPFLIFSDPNSLPEHIKKSIIDYVNQGGILYFSNANSSGLFDEFVGGICTGYTESDKTYVGPLPNYEKLFNHYTTQYPLPFPYKLPLVEGLANEETVAKIILPYTIPQNTFQFSSIHSNPPGVETDYPAIIIKKYGKGTVIWSAAPIENEPIFDYRSIMVQLVEKCIGEKIQIRSQAPENVELISFINEEKRFIQVNTVAISENDTVATQNGFEISVKTDKPIYSVELLPSKEKIPFKKIKNSVCFTTKNLRIFDMYQLLW